MGRERASRCRAQRQRRRSRGYPRSADHCRARCAPTDHKRSIRCDPIRPAPGRQSSGVCARLVMTCRPPVWRKVGTNSIGSLSEPTVMAVRSSRYSTGLMVVGVLQALNSMIRQMATKRQTHGPQVYRDVSPIIELRRRGILLQMVRRFGRFSALSSWMCLVMATAACFTGAAFSSEIELADRVVVHKAEHKLYLVRRRTPDGHLPGCARP